MRAPGNNFYHWPVTGTLGAGESKEKAKWGGEREREKRNRSRKGAEMAASLATLS